MKLRPGATPTLVSVDALLHEALLRTLEPAVAALNRLFDSAQPEAAADGEPDGISGVERRGPLSRLLASEWLLATEAPDEFMRRLDGGELGYLGLAHAEPKRPQTTLVLFDAGPDQLGNPRLAQLAALVVLARRAAAAGAELRWGTLQNPSRFPVSGPAVERFLAARTLAPPRELPPEAFVDECLVVSPRPGPPYAAQQLVLADAGSGVAAHLLDRRRGVSRSVQLRMPAPADAVRLLRNPAGAGGIGRGHRPISNLVFDEQGNKLLARIEPHRLAIYPVPNSPAEKPGRIRYVATGPSLGPIAAAGRVKRSVLTLNVVDDGTAVVLCRFGGSVDEPSGKSPVIGAAAMVPTRDTALGRVAGRGGALRAAYGAQRLTRVEGGFQADLADRSLRWGQPGLDLSATPTEGGWLVRSGQEEWRYDGGSVCGVLPRISGDFPQRRYEARILVVDRAGDALVALDGWGREEVLFRPGETILDAVAHHHIPTYALRTASGRVVVRSWWTGITLYEAYPE